MDVADLEVSHTQFSDIELSEMHVFIYEVLDIGLGHRVLDHTGLGHSCLGHRVSDTGVSDTDLGHTGHRGLRRIRTRMCV